MPSDVEKIRQQDALLEHQARLAQIGELLQNIAHQWRQPLSRLASMIMQAQLEQKSSPLSQKAVEKLFTKSNTIIEHMSQTLDDFSTFFQEDEAASERFDPLESCQDALEMGSDKEYLTLSVEDNGGGIDEEIMQKVPA